MELYFLRHGLAARRGDPKYKEDSLRPLTDEGRQRMHRTGLGMRALGLEFDAILSSPCLRAKQTAQIVAHIYNMKNKRIHLTNNLLPPASVEKLLGEIRSAFPKSKNVLLVGHEPHLSGMVSSLLKSDKPLNIDLKKGGLCSMSINQSTAQPNAVLNWLLTPAQLGLMAKGKR